MAACPITAYSTSDPRPSPSPAEELDNAIWEAREALYEATDAHGRDNIERLLRKAQSEIAAALKYLEEV